MADQDYDEGSPSAIARRAARDIQARYKQGPEQIGTVAPLSRNITTGEVTKGAPQPLMGEKISRDEF
jgi:hypothetical protein